MGSSRTRSGRPVARGSPSRPTHHRRSKPIVHDSASSIGSLFRYRHNFLSSSSLSLLWISCCWVANGLSSTRAFASMSASSSSLSASSAAENASSSSPRHFVGFDLGTSGARMSIVAERDGDDGVLEEIRSDSVSWSRDDRDDPIAWVGAVETMLARAAADGATRRVAAICVSGTSASCLAVRSRTGEVTRAPLMYDHDVVGSSATEEARLAGLRATERLETRAPPRHTTRARTSSLAKLLAWNEERRLRPGERLCHQSDYLAMVLTQGPGRVDCGSQRVLTVTSDWHNCLKLGYDVRALRWPDWLTNLLVEATGSTDALPSRVVSPGRPIGTVSAYWSNKRNMLPPDAVVVAGTTDSNAAFLAAVGGVDRERAPPGTAVTSLGSTLALKQLSETFVEDASRGVYSHRFPAPRRNDDDEVDDVSWLVGGASNVGCAVLRQESSAFADDELAALSVDMDPDPATIDPAYRDYYPLPDAARGERFPNADPARRAVPLDPPPNDRREHLRVVLAAIARVEREGYRALADLGASPPRPVRVRTAGGGARNDAWIEMRRRMLNAKEKEEEENTFEEDVRVERAAHAEASYGAALLAASSFS